MKPLLQTGLCGLLLVAGCAPGGNASPDPGQGNPNTGKADDGRSQPDDFSPPDSPLGELAVDRGEDPDTLAAEQAQFAMWAQEIRGIQDRLAYKNGNTIQRGFHAKSHLCVPGQLTLRDDRPDYTRFGIFSSSAARSYPVLMRFSNGVGFHQSDLLPDVRGLAVKVMGVSGLGTKLREDAVASDAQDFLTTNSPSQLAPDAAGFMEFARTQDDPDAFIAWGIRHPILSARLAARTAVPPTSLAGQIFYSDGAYRLGPRAVRFQLVPCPDTDRWGSLAPSGSRLRTDLTSRLNDMVSMGWLDGSQPICFDLGFQFQSSADDTPIEDASEEWETPLVWVGRIVPDPSPLDDTAEASCNARAFTPWHALEEHRPLGNINRVRRAVYAGSHERVGQPAQ